MKIKKIIYGLIMAITVSVVGVLFMLILQPLSTQVDAKYAAKIAKDTLLLSGVISAQELKGGFSGAKLFTVTSNSKKYVVRFADHQSSEQIQEGIGNLKNASAGGYGPHVYFADSEESVVIMEYLLSKYSSYGQHLKELLKPNQPKKLYVELGRFLQKIHRSPKVYRSRNIFEEIRERASKIRCSVNSAVPLAKIEDVTDIIYEAVLPYLRVAPCHNDLHPGNLMFLENEVKAVDYDDLAMGEPYFDVAAIAMFYCIDPACHPAVGFNPRPLLLTYLGREPSLIENAKFYLIKQAALLVCALRTLVVPLDNVYRYAALQAPNFNDCLKDWSEGKIDLSRPDDLVRVAKVFIEEAFSNVKSQEFKDAVYVLSKPREK